MRKIEGLPLPEAILRAAIQTFVERGFPNASMDEVAARASTTKRTVYAHFGSKDELFRAALATAVEMFQAELPELEDATDPAGQLERFAARFCDLSTWRGAVRLQRVAMAESERFPDIGGMLHREVIQAAEGKVAAYLALLEKQGVAPAELAEPRLARETASLFLNMATGGLRFATLLQAAEPAADHPDMPGRSASDRSAVRRAVQLLLAGFERK